MHRAGLCRQCWSTSSDVHCYDHNPSLRPFNQPADQGVYCRKIWRPYCSASGVRPYVRNATESTWTRAGTRYMIHCVLDIQVRGTMRTKYKVRGTVRTKYKVLGTRSTGYKVRGTCCIRFSTSCPFGTECSVFFWYHFRGSPVGSLCAIRAFVPVNAWRQRT